MKLKILKIFNNVLRFSLLLIFLYGLVIFTYDVATNERIEIYSFGGFMGVIGILGMTVGCAGMFLRSYVDDFEIEGRDIPDIWKRIYTVMRLHNPFWRFLSLVTVMAVGIYFITTLLKSDPPGYGLIWLLVVFIGIGCFDTVYFLFLDEKEKGLIKSAIHKLSKDSFDEDR